MVNTLVGFDAIADSSGDPLSLGGGVIGIDTGWVKLATKTADNTASSLDFGDTDFDISLYDEYELVVQSIEFATVDQNVSMRVSTDGGSTFHSTSDDYEYSFAQVAGSGTGTYVDGGNVATATEMVLVGDTVTSTTAGDQFSFTIHISNLSDTTVKKLFYGTGALHNSASNPVQCWFSGTYKDDTNAIDGIQFRVGSGNLVAGTAVLRGRLKAGALLAGFNPDWEVLTNTDASGTDIDFTFDPTLYDELQISVIDCEMDADDAAVIVQFSTDGGSTFHSTASDYQWARNGRIADDTEDDAGNTAAVSIPFAGATGGVAANEKFSATIWIYDPSATSHTRMVAVSGWDNQSGVPTAAMSSGKMSINTLSVDGLRITTAAGTATITGKIILRGRRKNPQTGSVDIDSTVQTTDGTETTLVSIPVASNQVIVIHGFGMGYDDSTGDTLVFSFTAGAQNEGGTTTSKSSTIDILDSDITGFDVTWDADDTGDVGRLRVTGAVATTVDWKVRYQITRIN